MLSSSGFITTRHTSLRTTITGAMTTTYETWTRATQKTQRYGKGFHHSWMTPCAGLTVSVVGFFISAHSQFDNCEIHSRLPFVLLCLDVSETTTHGIPFIPLYYRQNTFRGVHYRRYWFSLKRCIKTSSFYIPIQRYDLLKSLNIYAVKSVFVTLRINIK